MAGWSAKASALMASAAPRRGGDPGRCRLGEAVADIAEFIACPVWRERQLQRRVKAEPTAQLSPSLGPVQRHARVLCPVLQRLDSPGRDECGQDKGNLRDYIQHSPVITFHRFLEPLHISCREWMS
jgi:hypothetical protein